MSQPVLTALFDHDGILINTDSNKVVIDGNLLRVYGPEDNIEFTGHMEVLHNRIVWRLVKGQRGREIGVIHKIRVSGS